MIFRGFTFLLIVRLSLIGATMAVVVWLLMRPGLHSATAVIAVILVGLVFELWKFVSRTNRDLARFLDAARYADYSQRFNFSTDGADLVFWGRHSPTLLSVCVRVGPGRKWRSVV
jgi:hypothetical protein